MGFKKIGDWKGMDLITRGLKGNFDQASDKGLSQLALYAERVAVKHITSQDLKWQKLRPQTLALKARKGLSNKTLIATSDYLQSVTSFRIKKVAFAGVKKEARNKDGRKITQIAAVHEFGNNDIPARPLWRPTGQETVKWMLEKKLFSELVMKRIRR